MKPEKESCLVGVLDRLLCKGAVINADLIISVAGVPLIGLSLRAVLASMETMLEYGMMEAWDRSSREWYIRQEEFNLLNEDEEIVFKDFGYLWQEEGITGCWMPGVWNITTRRVFLWQRSPGRMLFETPLQGLYLHNAGASEKEIAGREELQLTFPGGSARVRLSERQEFEEAMRRAAGTGMAAAASAGQLSRPPVLI